MLHAGLLYTVSGIVIKGTQQARTLGCPTANLQLESPIPPGVYVGITVVDSGKEYNSCVYVFGDKLETHILGNHSWLELYDQPITVSLLDKLRAPVDFQNLTVEQIKAQILHDISLSSNAFSIHSKSG